jgi:hypothetical protein
MPKFTRRIKKHRKNRTYKSETTFGNIGAKKGGDPPDEERKGIVDIASEKAGDALSVVADTVEDVSLRALGLQKIDNPDNKNVQNIDSSSVNSEPGIVSDVGNVVNKTSTAVIDNINQVLDSQVVSESVGEAAKETAQITGKLAEKFNDAMNNPEVKEEVEEAINHAADVGTIVVKASEKPLQEVAKVGVEAGTKALGAASSGVMKVAADLVGAVPGLGVVVDGLRALNDTSKAVSAVVEAGSEAVETASDAFIETTENVKRDLKEFNEKKKMAEQISNRTTRSITNFENPLQGTAQAAGGRKTRRRLYKRKGKSKRVRFAI